MTDGTIEKKDTKMMLKEGEAMDMAGNVKTMHDDSGHDHMEK